jgi:hypothetical protein
MDVRWGVRLLLGMLLATAGLTGWAQEAVTPAAPPAADTATPAATPPHAPVPLPPASCPMPPAEPRSRVQYEDFLLDAHTIRMGVDRKDIYAEGDVYLSGLEGVFTASSLRYNLHTHSGYLDSPRGYVDPFRLSADSMSVDTAGTKQIQRATLTTCTREHPHYALMARDMVLTKEGRFRTRHVGVALAGHRLFSIPAVRGKIGLHKSQEIHPTLSGGISHLDGTYAAVNYDTDLGARDTLNLTARAGTAGRIRGAVTLSRPVELGNNLDDGELSLHLSWREDIQNRLVSSDTIPQETLEELTISRLPAVQLSLPTLPVTRSANPFVANIGAGYGNYREDPTHVTSDRGQLWGILTTPALNIGPTRLYGKLGARTAIYTPGHHDVTVSQLSLESQPKADRYFNLSYLRRTEHGASPFLFDRVDLPDELYAETEQPLFREHSPWWLNVAVRYDLNRNAVRNTTLTAIYKLDCISYGLRYDTATRGIGLGIVLNAFSTFHHGPGTVGFTQ